MPNRIPVGRWLAIAAIVALAFGVAASLAFAWSNAAGTRVTRPPIHVDASTRCIASAATMRRTHMRLLRHQRDRTVRDGVRGEPASLNACIECHAGSGTGAAAGSVAGSVAGSPQAFCETCHRYVAVRIDCFDCHQPRAAPLREARTETPR